LPSIDFQSHFGAGWRLLIGPPSIFFRSLMKPSLMFRATFGRRGEQRSMPSFSKPPSFEIVPMASPAASRAAPLN
jgi:hypothetical protein